MAPVHTIRMLEVIDTTSGLTVTAVVPAGFRWVVRNVEAINTVFTSGSLTGFRLGRAGGALPVGPYILDAVAGLMWQWEGRLVLDEGEILELLPIANHWSVSVSGYQLTLP